MNAIQATINDIVLRTQRGKRQIEFEQRLFREDNPCRQHKNNSNKTSYYFSCCGDGNCRGRLTICITQDSTAIGGEVVEYIPSKTLHSCTVNKAEICRKKAKVAVAETLCAGYRGG